MDKPTKAALILGVTVKGIFEIASEKHKHRNKDIKWKEVYRRYKHAGVLMLFVSDFCDEVISYHEQRNAQLIPCI